MLKLEKLSEHHATVENCPHTRKSSGVIYLEPQLISQLSAAVYDKDEWAIVLTGTREEGGWVVRVNDYFIPPQERRSAHVKILEFDQLDITVVGGRIVYKDGSEIVSVIHSHHEMGARFSGTDDRELNPRFPSSIVVGQDRSTYLGFEYEACGKVELPCGATGLVPFFIQPTVGPVVAAGVRAIDRAENLGDCVRYSNIADSFHIQFASQCGLKEPNAQLRARAFGNTGELLALVEQLPRPLPPAPKPTPQPPPQVTNKRRWSNDILGKLFGNAPLQSPPEDEDEDEFELILCEVCNVENSFTGWYCDNCGTGEYCYDCNVGHNPTVGCPQYAYSVF